MNNYLIRAEGINLENILNDTDQLSVIRGSGLMLRKSVKELYENIKESYSSAHSQATDIQEIARDASSVIMQFRADSDSTADKVLSESVSFFRERYPEFTFVVDWVCACGDFKRDQDRLTSANRLRQLQQSSLAIPTWNEEAGGDRAVCQASGVYPANNKVIANSKIVSDSVEKRFERGRVLRRSFYQEELGENLKVDFDFTDNLQSLADSQQYKNLNKKVAVIYFDGNSFGALQRSTIHTAKDKQQFDQIITAKHREFLKAQIQETQKDTAYQTANNETRMETLLWGGDEILLVVPAWRGFDTLMRFYETVDDMEYQGTTLSYAGGLVFSQANTSIHRLTSLAKQLAESVKEQLKKSDEPLQNRFEYRVLESMDYPSSSINELHERLYGSAANNRKALAPLNRDGFVTLGHILKNMQFPISQLVELANAYITKGDEAALLVKQRISKVIGEDSLNRVETHIAQLFSQDEPLWNWVHLAECRDYLLTEVENAND